MAKETKEENRELRQRFYADLETARRYMDPVHQQMDRNYEMYRNRWTDDEADFQVSDLYEYVETVVPILTNNRTRCTVHSEYPEYVRHAQAMTDILDHTYDVNNWDYEAQNVARMAEIYRSAIVYTGYDPEGLNGTGKLLIKPINIRWCYLDPAPTQFEESSFFFYVEPRRVTDVVRDYPQMKKKIMEMVGRKEGMMSHSDKRYSSSHGWFQSWIRSVKNALGFSDDAKKATRFGDYQTIPELDEEERRKGSVAFIHYWYRDENDEWRVSYWADELFLEDMENPFWHGQLPYDIYNPIKDILSPTGIPIAEHILNLNWEKNLIMHYIKEAAKRAVDPWLIYNTMSGVKNEDAEQLRRKAHDTGVIGVPNPELAPLNALADFFVPPNLPAYVGELPERMAVMADRVTGVNDSFRGLADATSGKEVQLKQEAAYTRIKAKVDNFEQFVKSFSEKTIINAMQFYKEWRAFRIKGDYRKYSDIQEDDTPFEVRPIPIGVDENGEPEYDRNEFFLYANPHEWTKIAKEQAVQEEMADSLMIPGGETNEILDAEMMTEEIDEEITKEDVQEAFKILQMTVEIDAGSSLPTSRMARREEAAALFQMGAIDQQALLEAYDWKDRDEIMKRMAEREQMMQQMEMMKQQLEQLQKMQPQAQGQAALPGQAAQPAAQQLPDIASKLDQIRAIVPEVANMTDQDLVALLANMRLREGREPVS